MSQYVELEQDHVGGTRVKLGGPTLDCGAVDADARGFEGMAQFGAQVFAQTMLLPKVGACEGGFERRLKGLRLTCAQVAQQLGGEQVALFEPRGAHGVDFGGGNAVAVIELRA